jgi:hypothetical protein
MLDFSTGPVHRTLAIVRHLAPLVDCVVHVAPHPGHPHVGLIDEPAITRAVPTRSRRFDHERREALHPPVDGHMIHLDAAFGEQFFDVAVRQAIPAGTSAL